MLDLGGATSLEVLHASVGGKAGGIPETHGRLHAEFILECAQRRCCVVGPVSPGASGQTILGHGSYFRDQKRRVAASRLLMILKKKQVTLRDTIWYNQGMTLCDSTIWYDLIWYEMIWYDLIWYDMIWFDMIWRDMICNRKQCVYSLVKLTKWKSSNLQMACLCACFEGIISMVQSVHVTSWNYSFPAHSTTHLTGKHVCKYSSKNKIKQSNMRWAEDVAGKTYTS